MPLRPPFRVPEHPLDILNTYFLCGLSRVTISSQLTILAFQGPQYPWPLRVRSDAAAYLVQHPIMATMIASPCTMALGLNSDRKLTCIVTPMNELEECNSLLIT